jgi:hypothetical protein
METPSQSHTWTEVRIEDKHISSTERKELRGIASRVLLYAALHTEEQEEQTDDRWCRLQRM